MQQKLKDVFFPNHWHALPKEKIFEQLKTSENGLSKGAAAKKLREVGLNEISKKRKTPPIFKFLKQFHSPLIYILITAMFISLIFKHFVDGYVILFIIFVNATIGFVQERKAERAIEALKKLIVSYAKVQRQGEITKIPAKEVVPGDIIFLEEGDKIPADARLLEISNFRTQESSLTGESLPQEKVTNVLRKSTILADRKNMVFMGTLAVSGTAKALVVVTGDDTSIGQVAESIQEIVQPKMHFNKKVSQLSFQMAVFALIGTSIVFSVGFFVRKLEFFEIFLFTISSLVSAIPEGLPAVLVIVLTVGARRMARRNAIIRHLPAVETLGVATIIATDKTGTLTENSITVEKIITPDEKITLTGNGWEPLGRFYLNKTPIHPLNSPSLRKLLSVSAICNKGILLRKDGGYEIEGDPTEVSLLVLGKKAGLEKKKLQEKIIDDLAFSSELKFRATLIELQNKKQVYSVGAFEAILEKSSHFVKQGKNLKLNNQMKTEFLSEAENLAKQGYRVLALAFREVPHYVNAVSKELVSNLTFIGFVGMKDPPRPEIKEAIKKARNAGIRVIMKTGDHKETAIAIAKEIGLVKRKIKVLTQNELEKMSDSEFSDAVKRIDIFARVTPKMKLKIIQELQNQGNIVAMTGDGVNDAPALKRADIGVAMGVIGTDVAREASEMVLADDNFASIVNAIEEGRIVFQNVRQTSFYLVTTNVAEQVVIVGSLIIGLPLPLLPIQLLYQNLVTDTFNGMGLAMEPGHHDVLKQPPRDKKEKILNKEVIGFLLLMGGLMALGTIPLFYYFLPQGIEKARTIAFLSMSMFQWFNVMNMRSLRKSLFKIGIFSNKIILLSIAISLSMVLSVIYLPFIASIFTFVPLKITEFLLVMLVASSIFVVGEIYKKLKY